VLSLPDSWVWDFWFADDGEHYHLFFLRAPRALRDPDLRHRWASLGHAVSTDLRRWTVRADALVAADAPAPDDRAIWTGCVVRPSGGSWHLFYTGLTEVGGALVQTTCLATSDDLDTWTRHSANPVLRADRRWYATLGPGEDNEPWRDPWVFPDPDGDGWHLIATARARTGPAGDRGVLGHARSPDLLTWTAQPPVTAPGARFDQLEVPQLEVVDGRPLLLFSCLHAELGPARRAVEPTGGIWMAEGPEGGGVFDAFAHVGAARLVSDDRLYVGRMIRDRNGEWMLLAFHNRGQDGRFVGTISDPMPIPRP
jgi:beta-fructofuranosidase